MSLSKASLPLALFLATFLIGCGSTKSYKVEVANRTAQPVTLWLTKDGPPREEGWLAPEDLTTVKSDRELQYDFLVVDPTRTGYTDTVKGQFPGGTHAVLRVYPGTPNYFDMAKMPPESRVEQVLKPGGNKFTLTESDGRLSLQRR
jgi:hypothetical protein